MNRIVREATEKEKEKIPMLLDIEHFYGQSEGRLAPLVTTLIIIAAPVLLYVYFGLFTFIPLWAFIPVEIIVAIRVIMIIPGREAYRLRMFRRQLYDEYTSTANLINIRTIHSGGYTPKGSTVSQDGLVEYMNGNIAYYVQAYNGTVSDDIQHTRNLRKFINQLCGEHPFDVYVMNMNTTMALNEYYKKITNFERNESADNFIKILDHNKERTENNSMLQTIIFCIKGQKSDWREMKVSIVNTLKSKDAKCFKSVKLLETEEEINAVINRNIDTVVNINDLLRRKYRNEEYGTSKVIKFDVTDNDVIQIGTPPKNTILPPTAANSFHVAYEDAMNPQPRQQTRKWKKVTKEIQ